MDLWDGSGAELSSVLNEPSDRPEVMEKFREEGCPESGELDSFCTAPLGIFGTCLASSVLDSDSGWSTSSTDSKT